MARDDLKDLKDAYDVIVIGSGLGGLTCANMLARDGFSVLLLEHRSLDPELKKLHIPRRDRVEKQWQEIITEGINKGYFQTDRPGLTAKALLGVINWTITWYREDGPLSPSEIADHFTDLFYQGLLVDQ